MIAADVSGQVHGVPTPGLTETASGPELLAGPGFFELLGPVVLVLVLTAAVLLLVRWLRGRAQARPHGAGLQVVDRLDLSPAHTLYVVRAEGRRLLLGGGPGGLSLITQLDGPLDGPLDGEAPAAPELPPPGALPARWAAWLRGPRPAPTSASPDRPEGPL